MGKANESLKTKFSYGVSAGPSIVAVHESRLPSALGKAEIPGEGESISCINSDCRLNEVSLVNVPRQYATADPTYRLVTL